MYLSNILEKIFLYAESQIYIPPLVIFYFGTILLTKLLVYFYSTEVIKLSSTKLTEPKEKKQREMKRPRYIFAMVEESRSFFVSRSSPYRIFLY